MNANNPKAQFQINNGAGWQTIAEADIIDGVAQAPNAWTMVRAMQKRVVYTGYTPVKITVVPSDNNRRDTHFIGFADQLIDELLETNALDMLDAKRFWEINERQEVIQLLARRAYDLVLHTVWRTIPASGSTIAKYEGLTIAEIANAIPDMPELPEGTQL